MLGSFTCLAPPGSVDLTGYPNLVYAPLQWGDRVVVIGGHHPAGDVAAFANGSTREKTARRFGCTVPAVDEAVRWALSHPDA